MLTLFVSGVGFSPGNKTCQLRRMYQRGWSTNSSYIGRTIWTSFHLGLCRNWDSNVDIDPNMTGWVVFDFFSGKDAPEFFCVAYNSVSWGFCGNTSNIRSAEFSHIFSETQNDEKEHIDFFLSFSTLHIVFTPFGVVFYCWKFEASYMLVTMGIFNVILAVPWIEQTDDGLKVAWKWPQSWLLLGEP